MIEYENLNRLNQPFIRELRDVFDSTLNNGMFILGRLVEEFEKEFANYCGATHAIGVGNGLDALTMALRCFSFERGSEIIVPSNTYIATILAIVNSGLRPILVEPNPGTYNLDPNLVERAITPKTAAILAVHLYGKCCPMDEILFLCSKHNLRLIEDCAHAHGAAYKNRKAGTFGDFGAYSFYPTKNLGALGDAGALITNDPDLAARIRSMRNYGSVAKDNHDILGVNSRLDEIQAGFLLVKLKALDQMNEKRRGHAKLYTAGLDKRFTTPETDEDFFDVYYVYNIRHPERNRIMEHLVKHEIEVRIHYPTPPHQQKALRQLVEGSFPVSEEIHRTTLSLPVSPIHSVSDINEIVGRLNDF